MASKVFWLPLTKRDGELLTLPAGEPGTDAAVTIQQTGIAAIVELEIDLDAGTVTAELTSAEAKPRTLGDVLARTQAEARDQKLRASRLRDEQAREEAQKERAKIEKLVGDIQAHIQDKIQAGLVPAYKVKDYDNQSYIRAADAGRGEHSDKWADLVEWARVNDLKVLSKEEHDGVGIKSWITVTVEPIQ